MPLWLTLLLAAVLTSALICALAIAFVIGSLNRASRLLMSRDGTGDVDMILVPRRPGRFRHVRLRPDRRLSTRLAPVPIARR
jgi:hypothetical protein